MKQFYFLVGLLLLAFAAKSQTAVSGGIYTNTTWTKAGSPYTILDTVVVFPGVTLTINPGVVVRFANNKRLELRQASIVASGTNTDSIVFTSAAAAPGPGSWGSIYLNAGLGTANFSHCSFHYASNAIDFASASPLNVTSCNFSFNRNAIKGGSPTAGGAVSIDSCIFFGNTAYGVDLTYYGSGGTGYYISINHSLFSNNETGFSGQYQANCFIRNSVIRDNRTGAFAHFMTMDSCIINHNKTGVTSYGQNIISHCVVDSNTSVGIASSGDSIVQCVITHSPVGIHSHISSIYNCTIEANSVNIKDKGTAMSNQISFIVNDTIRNGLVGIDSMRAIYVVTKCVIEHNGIGILLMNPASFISCNKISNNSPYNLRVGTPWTVHVENNYWGADSTTTRSSIYDGYVNVNAGLASFMPIDTSCYLTLTDTSVTTSITQMTITGLKIYPNPTLNYFIIETPEDGTNYSIRLLDLLGRQQSSMSLSIGRNKLDVSTLSSGIYMLQIAANGRSSTERLIKQ